MLAIIQEIASKSYTFREVAAYVTISVCMSFAVGFLLAAFARIFKEQQKEYVEWSKIPIRYTWVALDNHLPSDAHLFMFEKQPYIDDSLGDDADCWLWQDGSNYESVPIDAIIGKMPPWRESLRRRPS